MSSGGGTLAGQAVLSPAAAADEVAALEQQLVDAETRRSAAHAEQLRQVHAFAVSAERGGVDAGPPAHLALVLSCSEWRAHDLLLQAAVLQQLTGAAEELVGGGLTVEQWATVARALAPLAPADAELVWQRLLHRLAAERARGVARPPARLAELVRRLVAELLPDELAGQRRRNGGGPGGDDVTYEHNDDGSADRPDGPTCACNLGPLCRHHHRVKQLGWTKDRLPGGAVRWTSPTGSTFTSPAQLPPVPTVLRRLPPPPARSEPHSPLEDERELWLTTPWDALREDSRAWVPPDPGVDPHGDRDRTRDALTTGGTRWTLDLHDPSQWAEPAPLPVEPAG